MAVRFDPDTELLDHLYAASEDPALWNEFLAHVSRRFDAPWTALLSIDPSSQNHSLEAHFGVPPEVPLLYETYYGALDPWYLAYKKKDVPDWAGAGSSLYPTSELEKSEFYEDFLRPFGAHHICAAIIEQGKGRMAALTALRERQQPEYGARHARLMERLHPHLSRALRLHGKFLDLKQATAAATSTIDALDIALVGVDPDGKVSFLNGAAEKLLRSSEILQIQDGKLVVRDAQQAAALDNLRKMACVLDMEAVPGDAITLRRNDRSLHISVLPFHAPGNSLPVRPRVFLILTDPDATPKSRERLLVRLFRLSPAEARVAMLVVAGLELKEIAARTHTTSHTVRSHLKSIFRKTCVTRQSQLTRLISRLPGAP